jgi:hypothetical protein
MLGEKIDDLKAKVTGTRVLPGNLVETSFQGQGRVLGVDCQEMGTYASAMTAHGVLNGEGQGMAMSAQGDVLTWKGSGVGWPNEKGGTTFRYSLVMQTASPKWARLNKVLGVGEWEIDAQGNGHATLWEWK